MVAAGKLPRRTSWIRWLRGALLAVLAAWLIADLLRTASFAVQAWGPLAGITDSVFVFRLGEALILLPFAAFLLVVGRDPGFLRRWRWVMWAGALLAGISFLGLNGRLTWAPLALGTAGLGLGLPWLAGVKTGCAARLAGWLGFAGLVLLHLFIMAAAFLFHGYTVTPYPAVQPRPAATRDGRWQQDVRYLGSELARLHRNAFHTTTEETYRAQIEQLENAAPSLTDAQIAIEMMRITASVGDAHTGLSIRDRVPLHGLPVDMRWYGDKLYVQGVSQEYQEALGAQVIKIGELPAEAAYQAVLPLISHENESWARLRSSNYLNVTEVLAAAGAIQAAGPVVLTLKNNAGPEYALEIEPLDPGQMVDYLSAIRQPAYYQSRPDEAFWFDYLEASRTLYFRYAACIDLLGFRATMRELWKVVDERPVDRLVVDLRGNGGGNSFQFDRYFMPGLKAHPDLDHPERLFVLIDRGTFSSASDNAANLRLNSQATFIGQPTGGKPNSYGEVRQFQLPNSRLVVSYSTNFFQLLDSDPPSIEPDIYVYTPAEAAFSGRDPVLEAFIPIQ